MSEGDDRDDQDRQGRGSDGASSVLPSPDRPGATPVAGSRVRWTRAQLLEINDRLQGAVRELGAENNALTEHNVALRESNVRLERLVSESIRQLMNQQQRQKFDEAEARQGAERVMDLSPLPSPRLRVWSRFRALFQSLRERGSRRRLDAVLGPMGALLRPFVGG